MKFLLLIFVIAMSFGCKKETINPLKGTWYRTKNRHITFDETSVLIHDLIRPDVTESGTYYTISNELITMFGDRTIEYTYKFEDNKLFLTKSGRTLELSRFKEGFL